MRDSREVLITYDDEPDFVYRVTVCVDGTWVDEQEDEDDVFFYFNSEDELRDAVENGTSLGFEVLEVLK
jgi:hypothetical protein